jgi:hypothetical protein
MSDGFAQQAATPLVHEPTRDSQRSEFPKAAALKTCEDDDDFSSRGGDPRDARHRGQVLSSARLGNREG